MKFVVSYTPSADKVLTGLVFKKFIIY